MPIYIFLDTKRGIADIKRSRRRKEKIEWNDGVYLIDPNKRYVYLKRKYFFVTVKEEIYIFIEGNPLPLDIRDARKYKIDPIWLNRYIKELTAKKLDAFDVKKSEAILYAMLGFTAGMLLGIILYPYLFGSISVGGGFEPIPLEPILLR